MKKIVSSALAGIAAVVLIVLPVVSAQAATAQVGSITGFGGYQYGTAVSPDGNIHAVSDTEHSRVYFVYQDSSTYASVIDTIASIHSPHGLAFTPDGTTLFIANNSTNNVLSVDVTSRNIVNGFNTASSGNTVLAVTPDGSMVLVANSSTDDITVYSTSSPYAQLGGGAVGGNTAGIFVIDNMSAYIVDSSGDVRLFDLTTYTASSPVSPGIGDLWGATGSCAMPNLSAVVLPMTNVVHFVDPVTGSELGSVNIKASDASQNNNAFCVTTADGHVVVTDWGRGAYANNPGYVYVLDGNTFTYLESVQLTDVPSSGGITLNNDCQIFVDGYFGNVAIAQLDASYCVAPPPTSPPTDSPSEASLPSTGVDTTALALAAGAGLALIVLGSAVMVALRRR